MLTQQFFHFTDTSLMRLQERQSLVLLLNHDRKIFNAVVIAYAVQVMARNLLDRHPGFVQSDVFSALDVCAHGMRSVSLNQAGIR